MENTNQIDIAVEILKKLHLDSEQNLSVLHDDFLKHRVADAIVQLDQNGISDPFYYQNMSWIYFDSCAYAYINLKRNGILDEETREFAKLQAADQDNYLVDVIILLQNKKILPAKKSEILHRLKETFSQPHMTERLKEGLDRLVIQNVCDFDNCWALMNMTLPNYVAGAGKSIAWLAAQGIKIDESIRSLIMCKPELAFYSTQILAALNEGHQVSQEMHAFLKNFMTKDKYSLYKISPSLDKLIASKSFKKQDFQTQQELCQKVIANPENTDTLIQNLNKVAKAYKVNNLFQDNTVIAPQSTPDEKFQYKKNNSMM